MVDVFLPVSSSKLRCFLSPFFIVFWGQKNIFARQDFLPHFDCSLPHCSLLLCFWPPPCLGRYFVSLVIEVAIVVILFIVSLHFLRSDTMWWFLQRFWYPCILPVILIFTLQCHLRFTIHIHVIITLYTIWNAEFVVVYWSHIRFVSLNLHARSFYSAFACVPQCSEASYPLSCSSVYNQSIRISSLTLTLVHISLFDFLFSSLVTSLTSPLSDHPHHANEPIFYCLYFLVSLMLSSHFINHIM